MRALTNSSRASLRTAYPDAKVVLDENYRMQDRSFLLWTFTGTNTGPGAAPPTDKSVMLTDATFMRYQDGKIAEERVYFDVLDWHMQLGYTMTPPAAAEAPATQNLQGPTALRRSSWFRCK